MEPSSNVVLPTPADRILKKSVKHNTQKIEFRPFEFHPFGSDGFTFSDLLDVINPLHHIPVIGPIYRSITGDDIETLPRITGSTLFVGPVGAGLAAAETILEVVTGKDTGAHFFEFLKSSPIKAKTEKTFSDQITENDQDGEDSVKTWAEAEVAYRTLKQAGKKKVGSPEIPFHSSAASGPKGSVAVSQVDPVVTWAKAESAYRAGLATSHVATKGGKVELL